MIIKSDSNFFDYTEGTKYIYLIDKKCALSGNTMKQCNYRSPDQIKRAKEKMKINPPNIGSCYLESFSLFIVARETYRSKWNEDTFEQIWKAIVPTLAAKNYCWHFNTEDYPWVEDIVKKYDRDDLNLILYHRCEW